MLPQGSEAMKYDIPARALDREPCFLLLMWSHEDGRARRSQSLEAFGCQDADISSKSVRKRRPGPPPPSTVCLPVHTAVTQSQPTCPPSAHRVVGIGFRIQNAGVGTPSPPSCVTLHKSLDCAVPQFPLCIQRSSQH